MLITASWSMPGLSCRPLVAVPGYDGSAQWKRLTVPLGSHDACDMFTPNESHTPRMDPMRVFCRRQGEMIPRLEHRTMDSTYDILVEDHLMPFVSSSAAASGTLNHQKKYVVGLAGPPGSGKSTLACEVCRRLNQLWRRRGRAADSSAEDIAAVLPMDGFHLYRHQLDSMKCPEEAHARRGAPWTFSPELLLSCLNTLKKQGFVQAPSFDHAVGDPKEDDVSINIHHRIVIVEGNYLLMEEGVWKDIARHFDVKWFIEVDTDTAMRRVLSRHIFTAGVHPDVAKWRVDYNDRPNAELINASINNADLIIKSISST